MQFLRFNAHFMNNFYSLGAMVSVCVCCAHCMAELVAIQNSSTTKR